MRELAGWLRNVIFMRRDSVLCQGIIEHTRWSGAAATSTHPLDVSLPGCIRQRLLRLAGSRAKLIRSRQCAPEHRTGMFNPDEPKFAKG